jgi:hypothetical protein
MRSSLRSLAGQRAKFAATFGQVSRSGNILLKDLQGPAGHEDHIWVAFRQWHGKLMMPETEFNFSARVGAYDHPDGAYDFGLIEISDIQVVQ